MRTLCLMTVALALAVLPAAHAVAQDVLHWPEVGRAEDVHLQPMTDQRVGFTLDEDADGRRVVVAIRGFAESEKPSGYNHSTLAVDVNGEIMEPHIAEPPRLLNRPEEIPFGPDGERTTSA